MLIINADDFGLSERVNLGILEAFKKGLCSSATLMPNMPGFEQACQLIHENHLLSHIGVHLVFTDGAPLTEEIKHCRTFCDSEGRLCFKPDSFFPWMDNSQKAVLAREVRAQIRRLRQSGIPITHLDSHYNLHTIWPVAGILIAIAKEERIPFMRIKSNLDFYALEMRFKIYTLLFNNRLWAMKLSRTRFSGSIRAYLSLLEIRKGGILKDSLEVCVHPRLNDTGRLISLFFQQETDMEKEVSSIPGYSACVSFSGAKYL